MFVYANWLSRIDETDGDLCFRRRHEGRNWKEYVVDRQLFHVTRLFPHEIKHLVFLEYDGDINQIFTLEEDEHFTVYSDGRCDGVFNTDGSAFFQVIRNGQQIAAFEVPDSPYDLKPEEFEEEFCGDVTQEDIVNKMREIFSENEINTEVTWFNVLFVRQL